MDCKYGDDCWELSEYYCCDDDSSCCSGCYPDGCGFCYYCER